jgi:hypothetical protein
MSSLRKRLDKIEADAAATERQKRGLSVWYRVPPEDVPDEHAGMESPLCSEMGYANIPPAPGADTDREPPVWIDESELPEHDLNVIVVFDSPPPEVSTPGADAAS